MYDSGATAGKEANRHAHKIAAHSIAVDSGTTTACAGDENDQSIGPTHLGGNSNVVGVPADGIEHSADSLDMLEHEEHESRLRSRAAFLAEFYSGAAFSANQVPSRFARRADDNWYKGPHLGHLYNAPAVSPFSQHSEPNKGSGDCKQP